MKIIVAPVMIPATYHNHVHPRFADANQIIVMIDNSKNSDPRSNKPRIRNTIPENIPASENTLSINGNHGEFSTPLMKMSAVDDA
jgi:hypothetical protein